MPTDNKWNDQDIDQKMGKLLQLGVIAAAVVMLTGGVIYLVQGSGELPDYRHFKGAAESFRSIPKIVLEALHGNAKALIQVGTLLMIATPVARVAFAAYAFARSHDKLYVAISSTVLALLLYGLLVAR
jgi:uncharacterized membrane protein